ncbi:F0F1 ATP synthase subunit gamma [Pseudomonadota bacterium]
MSRINEIKEEKVVVKTVGEFAGSLQQIAAARMVKLRKVVLQSRRFVDEATIILKELELERTKKIESELTISKSDVRDFTGKSTKKKTKNPEEKDLATAIIVVTSNQGLSGSYNTDIIRKVETIIPDHQHADFFVIGSKGQAYFRRVAKKYNVRYYPYNIPETVGIEDLRPLINMFYHYDQIYMLYSKYINTATRDVVFIELAVPNIKEVEVKKEQEEGKFIFEPSIEEIIRVVTAKLRYSLFRQQILDSKLSLYTSQMIAMKTASDNAEELLKDLQLQYNKARRKLIDKKIQEVQAGRSLWDEE